MNAMCRFMAGIMVTAFSNAAAAQNMSTNLVRQPVDTEYRGQGHTVVFRTVSVVPVRMHDAFRGSGHRAVARSDTLRLSPADLWQGVFDQSLELDAQKVLLYRRAHAARWGAMHFREFLGDNPHFLLGCSVCPYTFTQVG